MTHVYTYTYTCIHMCTYIYTCSYTCSAGAGSADFRRVGRLAINTYTYMYTLTYMHICIYMRVYIHVIIYLQCRDWKCRLSNEGGSWCCRCWGRVNTLKSQISTIFNMQNTLRANFGEFSQEGEKLVLWKLMHVQIYTRKLYLHIYKYIHIYSYIHE